MNEANIKVSEVTISPIKPRDGLVALCSFVINNYFFVGSVGIYLKQAGGYRLTYPTKKVGNSSMNIFYPITKEIGVEIEKQVIEKYEELISSSIEDNK